MALPDVNFSNNASGAGVSIKQCMIGVNDRYEWDGRAVRHVKEITIDGMIERGDNATDSSVWQGVMTNPAESLYKGSTGTLTLPWTILNDVMITGVSYPNGIWAQFHPVSISFTDDSPDTQLYTLTLFGFTLHNPRLVVPIPSKTLNDSYMLMPWDTTGVVATNDVRNAILRTKTGEQSMDFRIGGTIQVSDFQLPPTLVDDLTMRVGFGTPPRVYPGLPAGWPCPFNMGDAVPELKFDFPVANAIVAGGNVVWDVENGVAGVDIQIIAPPQLFAPESP